ncbi:hypothetical protein SNOG_07572 [Parastagonospora nodorum SN15]|uniref:DUF1690 domain-containing protein n=1 Tax=Phaeosphaeria nodorum (strain SN15 / ATCC MYA-4574 / FGSC 10173) TaxID=321614 RepID=Q0UKZ2_PHANO|nr:hypothetical protein SNOG_07572 [Parastagonospora nodorum SN15]EAT85038.2 hypothetical protein SNOG_07572 [Parastagonospora nodorum SN15]
MPIASQADLAAHFIGQAVSSDFLQQQHHRAASCRHISTTMGAENSKPSSDVKQHVFSPKEADQFARSEHPVKFSNELVDSLQKNTFTDSTRSRQQELQYQERLTAELEKLREQEAQNFTKYSETLSGESDESSQPSLVEKLSDATSSKATLAEKQRQKEMSRNSVTEEVEQLRQKLANRKKLEQVDAEVSKAKEAVVACLRTHDRRPLDCWKEIETFKKEVGRLEKDFVEKTIR